MVEITCLLGSYTGGAKGGRINLNLDTEQARAFEAVFCNFRDKPLRVNINVDGKERLAQLSRITDEQRKKVYALFKEIGNHFGNTPEETKQFTKAAYCGQREIEGFSLSDCAKELATDFIDWMVEFCLEHGVLLGEHPNKYISDLARYQLACLKNSKCCVCGKDGEGHHYDQIGISHERGNPEDEATLRKMCLCRVHHSEAHTIGRETFCEKYHVEPVLFVG